MSHGPCSRVGAAVCPACCAIMRAAPISDSAAKRISTRWILVFMFFGPAIGEFRVLSYIALRRRATAYTAFLQAPYYQAAMLHYHVAFHLPQASGAMVVAEVLDFPIAETQGFDLALDRRRDHLAHARP